MIGPWRCADVPHHLLLDPAAFLGVVAVAYPAPRAVVPELQMEKTMADAHVKRRPHTVGCRTRGALRALQLPVASEALKILAAFLGYGGEAQYERAAGRHSSDYLAVNSGDRASTIGGLSSSFRSVNGGGSSWL